jgi:arylsulfatase A-like enzyme
MKNHFFFLLVVSAGSHASLIAEVAPARPNILLIMADDMGFSDIGCFGGEIETPNLDQLARDGMLFTQFYNNAKCTTTRASLLSGMYPRKNGGSIPLEIPTMGETMRGAGYQTALSGKWHLGSKSPQRPFDRGFDEFYGLMDGGVNFFDPAQPDPKFKGGKVRVFGHNDQLVTEFPPGFYTTDAFADHAITTIKRFAKEDRPFFLHLAFTAPHYPLHAFPEDIAKYRGKYRVGWDELRRQRHARQIELGIVDAKWPLPPPDSKSYDWSKANQDWEDLRMATYAAMVERMDRDIGHVLQTLKELGIEDNTVVMFLSDNGGCTEEPGGRDDTKEPGIVSTYTAVGPAWASAQNTPWRRYKSWSNEGGISTPFLVRWPGHVKPGSRTNQIGHIIDVLPTCLEAAGAKPLAEINGKLTLPLEGQSLMPVLNGGERPSPERLYWEWSGNCAVRDGKWKLVWDTLNPKRAWQLYDIEADRSELTDLAGKMPELVTTLSADYTRWAKSLGRAVPGKKGKWSAD